MDLLCERLLVFAVVSVRAPQKQNRERPPFPFPVKIKNTYTKCFPSRTFISVDIKK